MKDRFVALTVVVTVFLLFTGWWIANSIFPPPLCSSEIGTMKPLARLIIFLTYFIFFFGIYFNVFAEEMTQ